MKSPTLNTQNAKLTLVPPKVERDAPTGVKWLAGEQGRDTRRLMGIPDANNKPSTLEEERVRVQGFIDNHKHMAWMMNVGGPIIGVVEVSFQATEHLPLPSISIMIGDPTARGQGYGLAALTAVVNYLSRERKFSRLYARHLTTNTASQALLTKIGFSPDGDPYTDADGLHWQNVQWQR